MKKSWFLLGFIFCLFLFSSCQPGNVRKVELFTNGWKFMLGDNPAAKEITFDDSAWRVLNLPHDWSIEGTFSVDNPASPGGGALPGGIGWYRKKFVVPEGNMGKEVVLSFDGVYCRSSLWVNGSLVGERPNGYISFQYDITPYILFGQENVIAVRVDNSHQPNSRWYSGSGIYRNVYLTYRNPLHVAWWGTFITTPTVSSDYADINVSLSVENNYPDLKDVFVMTILENAEGKTVQINMDSIKVASKETFTFDKKMTVANPELWSVERPYLYNVTNLLFIDGSLVDNYETTIGIRYFEFDSQKGFSLNGKPLKIKGVCNHHDLGCLGSAVNLRAIERQLQILKEMGCNGIRTSHNPPAPELLDLCDKMGFIVMDEAFDMWRKKKTEYDYANDFPQWYERDLKDLIRRDRNHPSIFMWSVGNEVLEQWTHVDADTLDVAQANMVLNFAGKLVSSESESDETLHFNSILSQKLVSIVRELDSTRPITSANNEVETYNHIFKSNAMDIIGFNYHEYAWDEHFFDKYPDQKLILTETTSSLMSRGFYRMPSDSFYITPSRWDIPYYDTLHQCSAYDNQFVPWGTTHEKSWILTKKYDHIAGMYIWTGFDYLGEPTPHWWPSRSSYFGIIDLAGIPKDVYYMYKSEWSGQDVLHLFPHWNWKEGEIVDMWAYYNNADEVELFINGKSQGRQHKEEDQLHTVWRIPFEAGSVKAVSYKDGKEVLSQEIKTAGEAAAILLTADRSTIHADGTDLSYITAQLIDAQGTPLPNSNALVSFEAKGSGFIAGTDNGDPTDVSSSLKTHERHLFSGKCIAVLQSTQKKGTITLEASVEGLPKAKIRITTK